MSALVGATVRVRGTEGVVVAVSSASKPPTFGPGSAPTWDCLVLVDGVSSEGSAPVGALLVLVDGVSSEGSAPVGALLVVDVKDVEVVAVPALSPVTAGEPSEALAASEKKVRDLQLANLHLENEAAELAVRVAVLEKRVAKKDKHAADGDDKPKES